MMRALVVIALVACGPKQRVVSRDAPVPWEASGIDWAKPPALDAPLPFAPPKLDTFVLRNGVRVIVAPNPRLPIVAITAVIDGAGSRADRDLPGVAALTADMLDETGGTQPASVRQRQLEGGTGFDWRVVIPIRASRPTRQAVISLRRATRRRS